MGNRPSSRLVTSRHPARRVAAATEPALRRFVTDVLARIAPEAPVPTLRTDVALRDQVDLDSVDWMNVMGALEDGLGVSIPARLRTRPLSLDGLVACLQDRLRERGTARAPARRAVTKHRLADGRTVTIRPIRADDAPRVQHFLEASSPESRYGRFHTWVAAPSSGLVHFLTDVDPERCAALVCTVVAGAHEAVVGEARCLAGARPDTCELGILVEDDWQHSGIAGMLMERVIQAARARGWQRMEGLVLATNMSMLRLTERLGFVVERGSEDHDTVRIMLDLRAPRAGRPALAV